MHTKITNFQEIIWCCTFVGQFVCGTLAWCRRNTRLAIYLTTVVINSLGLFFFAHYTTAHNYLLAYCLGTALNYASEFYLVYTLYQAIRASGIPFRRNIPLFQMLSLTLILVAVVALPFPQHAPLEPNWRWFLAAGNLFYLWLSLALAAAPVYAWFIDSADDKRLLMIYLGFSAYASVHAGAIDFAIVSHISHRFFYLPTYAYFVALGCWGGSSLFSVATHQWDSSPIESLKQDLRAKHWNKLHSFRKVPTP